MSSSNLPGEMQLDAPASAKVHLRTEVRQTVPGDTSGSSGEDESVRGRVDTCNSSSPNEGYCTPRAIRSPPAEDSNSNPDLGWSKFRLEDPQERSERISVPQESDPNKSVQDPAPCATMQLETKSSAVATPPRFMPIPAGIASPSGTGGSFCQQQGDQAGSPAELVPIPDPHDVASAQEAGLKVPVSLSRKGDTKRLRGKSIVASGKTRCCSREPTPETEPLLRPDVLGLILLELIPTREAFLQSEVLVYGNWMDVSNLDEKLTRHALAWEGVALTQWLLQLRLLDTSWNQAIKNSSLWVQLGEVFFQFPGPPMQPTEQPFERFYSKLRDICVPCYLNDRITSSKGRRRPSFAFGWVPMCNNHSYIVKSVHNPPRHRALCWKCFDEGGKNANCAIVQTGDDEAFENETNQMGNACGACRKKALEEALNRSWKHLGILLRGSSALIHAPAMRYINWGDWSASDAAEEVASNYWLYCYTRWPDYYASTLQLLNESAVNEQRNIVLAFVETRPGDAGDLWHLWEHAWFETKAVLARTSNFRWMLTRIRRIGFSTVYHSLMDQYRNSLVFTENGRSARCPSIDDMQRLLFSALPRELDEEQEERTIRESVYEYLSQVARGGRSIISSSRLTSTRS
ncbi:hypothetical protein IE81DRAFT_80152 [Ceraceosorus guamensis]|uniref:Uncharacterized protein n=1 Tax=Ceraceosorus guamensis TaxID=1522189 RepID=A0A316WDY3_9BASI|nr:hypothetical protein IE81DRAFT_80152 [Ceraceosorus guamensis]PWN46013.1 hypothetical protein IE81DRAFT_80152 [Ceraceosorus guamensis]